MEKVEGKKMTNEEQLDGLKALGNELAKWVKRNEDSETVSFFMMSLTLTILRLNADETYVVPEDAYRCIHRCVYNIMGDQRELDYLPKPNVTA